MRWRAAWFFSAFSPLCASLWRNLVLPLLSLTPVILFFSVRSWPGPIRARQQHRIVQRCAFLAPPLQRGLPHLNPLYIHALYIFAFPFDSFLARAPCLPHLLSLGLSSTPIAPFIQPKSAIIDHCDHAAIGIGRPYRIVTVRSCGHLWRCSPRGMGLVLGGMSVAEYTRDGRWWQRLSARELLEGTAANS